MKKFIFLSMLLALSATAFGAANPVIFNGGVTVEERESAPDRGTRLVFFVTAGNFLSNIDVIVSSDSGSELVNTTTEGPWLILDLDPGRYQVTAERSNGEVQSLVIEVGESSQEFGFSFSEEI